MFKIPRFTALFLLLLIFSNSFSQDKTIDSFKVVLQNPKIHDTLKLYSASFLMGAKYNDYQQGYYQLNDLMGALAFKNYHKKNPPELHTIYTMYLASYYNILAIRDGQKRDVVKAMAHIDKSIALFKSVKDYENMNFALIAKGGILSDFNAYDKAISTLFTALAYFEKYKPAYASEGIANVQSQIASIYSKQGKEEKAIAYNEKVIAFYDKKTALTAQEQYLKSLAHSNAGTSFLYLKKYPEANVHFNKALDLSRKVQDHTTTSVILTKLAQVKMAQSKFSDAELLLNQALSGGDIGELATANAYIKLGDLQYRKKDYARADAYLSKAFELSRKIMNLQLQEQASELLVQVSLANKNFKKAFEVHQFFDRLMDSSKTEASKNLLSQQELKYGFEKKELNYKLAAEREKAAKNNWLIGLSGVLLLLLLGGYFYYRNNRQKQAIAALEKNQIKQKLLITQMNPHFIFNSIENIRSLIAQNQNNDAVNYLGKFSKLTRQILENSNENYISLAEEIEMTENYLIIQQLLYNNKFNFNIAIAESVETDSIFLPPMLTQPFIENAIKHGLSNTTENGMIEIRFYLKEAKLFFEVSDNGKGFDDSHKTNNHKSLAMTITKERLVTYTKNQDFVVQTDNIIGKDASIVGAKVLFEIPYIYEN